MELLYKKIDQVIFDHQYNTTTMTDNKCIHNYILQDAYYEVCKKCGECNDKIYFITQNEDQTGYKEEKIRFKTMRYSKLKDIRGKLIDFNIRQQHKEMDKKEYRRVMKYIKENLPMKIIKQALKKTDSTLTYEEFFYCLKKPIKHEFTNNQINEIISICEKFIKTYKEIKNINKKALVYVIIEDKYNYILSNWVCSMNKNIIDKYRIKLQELNLSVKAVAASSQVL